MWNWTKKSKQVLGMNARNLSFIRPGNNKRAIDLVNDKIRTKYLLKKHGLPVSESIAIIKDRKEFYNFKWDELPNSFVLKPNRGLGGEGILVTYGKKKNGKWVLPLNREASLKDIVMRVNNILDGDYSKTNAPDAAFFEERLKIHPAFKLYSYKGVPDIRVIIYNKVPIMAMLRLPTKASGGRANLHKGGLGVGIDITSGITTHAIMHDQVVEFLPDMKIPLRGIQIPFWDEILQLSIEATNASGLRFCGADIAIDKEKGPVVLELNAHPGLSIQNANLSPLKDRLVRVKGLKIKTVKKGIKVAKELFGGDFEQEIEKTTGKKILGIINNVKVKDKKGNWHDVQAKLDTGAGVTSIDEQFARDLGYHDAIDFYQTFNIKPVMTREEVEELSRTEVWKEMVKHKDIVEVVKVFSSHGVSYRIEIPLKLMLSGLELNSNASVTVREHLDYRIIIGKRDLKKFLIDPTK
jgi:alpha-L-glutamate ligase-like protein